MRNGGVAQHCWTDWISTHVGFLDDDTSRRKVNACCKAACRNNDLQNASVVSFSYNTTFLDGYARV